MLGVRVAALLVLGLLLCTPLVSNSHDARAQTSQPCTPTTCQQAFPADVPSTTVVAVQGEPQPPVFGGDMYVSNKASNTVSVILGTSNIGNVSVGDAPLEPAYDPDNGYVYVPNAGSDTVSVLSGAGVEATVEVGYSPTTPAYDPANGYVYVPITGACNESYIGTSCGDTVAVISGTTLIANITVGGAPSTPAVDTVGGTYYGYVYVPNEMPDSNSEGTVSIISPTTNQVVTTLELGYSVPAGAFFDEENGYVYAGAYVISGVTELGELTAGSCTFNSCVLDTYSGVVYSLGGTTMFTITGTSSSQFFCETCGATATFNPLNGWIYAGWVIAGNLPFADVGFSTETSGSHDQSSFDPDTGVIYASCGGCYYYTNYNTTSAQEHFGSVTYILGNTCSYPGPGYYYNSTLSAICGGALPPAVTTQSMPLINGTTGLPEALGNHTFSLQLDSVNLVSGAWIAQTSAKAVGKFTLAKINFTVTGPSGTQGQATIIIPKVLVALYLWAQLGGTNDTSQIKSALNNPPILFIDGDVDPNFSLTQDSNNIYITFQVHFSTHNMTLEFNPNPMTSPSLVTSTTSSIQSTQSSLSTSSQTTPGAPTTSVASSSSSSPSSSSELVSSYLLVSALSIVVVAIAGFLAVAHRSNHQNRLLSRH